ncbi:META domain-containing protein [Ulvibacter antarcticus]|uniref:Heat shock protein HslJ n=1 Tax=Ulvibacter antarcticus TaxID=442714 RepID=A0A3L9YYN7_9FLAO|nr:META domain-containing protein [Ulvibacter antarcticus]RMA64179.1 heat shock protein HslJ [Ulvibacter antarcticus]
MSLKYILSIALIATFTFSCNSNKSMTKPDTNPSTQLHDIWALNALNGEEIKREESNDRQSFPMLEIFVSEKRIGGNDGCNAIFGSIESLDATSISFGKMGGTKMMCPDMKLPSAYMKAMGAVTSYKIENLQLHLYNAEGDEVLKFLKVD